MTNFLIAMTVLSLVAIPLRAADRVSGWEDHRGSFEPSLEGGLMPSKGSGEAGAPVTRRDALVRGIRGIRLRPATLEELIRITGNNPRMDVDGFEQAINAMVTAASFEISREQAEQLKKLFKEELGLVKDSDLGAEFNQAAKQVLKEIQTASLPPSSQGAKGSAAGTQAGQDGKQPQNPPAAPLDSKMLEQFAKMFNKQPDDKKSGGANDSFGKELSKLGEMLKGIGGGAGLDPRTAGLGGKGLLDALRGAPEKEEKDDEKGNGKGGGDLGDLKNALGQHSPDGGKSKDDKKDDASKMATPDFKDLKKDRGLDPLMSLLKDKGGSDNDGKKKDSGEEQKKEEKPFDLASSKKSEPDKSSKDKDKDKKKSDSMNPTEPPVDPAAMADLMKKAQAQAKAAKGLGKKAALPGIENSSSGSSMDSSPLSNFSSSSGGGGTMGPNIVGSASAPASSGFDGDPFSSVGKLSWDGPMGPFNISKAVDYGGAVGGEMTDDNAGIVDIGTVQLEGIPKDGPPQMAQIVLPPNEDTGRPRMLMDYVGNWKKTLCEGGHAQKVELCRRFDAGKALTKRNVSSFPLQ